MNIFISATDTDVGKTFVTAGISLVMQSLGYKTGVFKPFQSGAEDKNGFLIAPDLAYIKRFDTSISILSSYLLRTPCSPELAAEIDNCKIQIAKVAEDYKMISSNCDFTITEGAGGLMVPLCKGFLIKDLIKFLKLPVVFVIRPDLGTINHTLLTIETAKAFGLNIRGIIINKMPQKPDIVCKTVPRFLQEYSDVNLLGIVDEFEQRNITAGNLIAHFLERIDFEILLNEKIPKIHSLGLK